MKEAKFEKILTANDVGETSSHQAGIAIPKQKDMIEFLPELDPKIKNPDCWIVFIDDELGEFRFRYVYYNNRLHDLGGTRNEYRITHVGNYLKAKGARKGSRLVISGVPRKNRYKVEIIHENSQLENNPEIFPSRITVRKWRRLH